MAPRVRRHRRAPATSDMMLLSVLVGKVPPPPPPPPPGSSRCPLDNPPRCWCPSIIGSSAAGPAGWCMLGGSVSGGGPTMGIVWPGGSCGEGRGTACGPGMPAQGGLRPGSGGSDACGHAGGCGCWAVRRTDSTGAGPSACASSLARLDAAPPHVGDRLQRHEPHSHSGRRELVPPLAPVPCDRFVQLRS